MKKRFTYFLLCLSMLCMFCFHPQTAQEVQAAKSDSKIHFLTLPGSTLAVLVESNGRFGMIDSGESWDYPDGSNPRYPARSGNTTYIGFDNEVLSYLESVGVTQDNFDFYIGTHPHSDHIGTADTVIRKFHPKRVYCPEYKDIYITNPARLWDNLYIYDNMITAAKEVGASIILNFDENAPVYPELIDINGSGNLELESSETEDETISDEDTIETVTLETESIRDSEKYTVTLTNTASGETTTQTVTSDPTGHFTYSFTGLPKYDDNRNEIPYTVTIDEMSLTPTITDYVPGELGASPGGDTPYGGKEGLYEHISEEQSTVGNPNFTFGDLSIQILNTNPDYKTEFTNDANDFSLVVLIESPTQKALVTGDLNNFNGDEDALIPLIGEVDLCSIAHHGYYGSNSPAFINSINPKIMVLPNIDFFTNLVSTVMPQNLKGHPIYVIGKYANNVNALVFDMNNVQNNNVPKGQEFLQKAGGSPETYVYYKDGLPVKRNGILDAYGMKIQFNNDYYGYSKDEWVSTDKGWRYHTKEDTYLTNEWLTLDGETYYLNSKGYMVTGWSYIKNQWYYFNSNGEMQIGWVTIGSDSYFFYNDGHMAANQMTPDGNYVDSSGRWIPGKWYHNSHGWWYQDGNGTYPKDILRTIDGYTYYFDPYGYIVYGWNYLHGYWYYFDASGHMCSGWQYLGNNWYYLDSKGKMQTGWVWIDDYCYYFYANGHMAANTTIGGSYVDSSGKWVKDQWISSGGYWWYRHGDGSYTKDGWEFINNHWYHFDASGWMQTGWVWIDGYCYYFHENGYMASDETIDGNYVNSSGCWVPDRWLGSGDKWWYRHGDGSCTKFGWEFIDGAWYFFDINGWMETGWLQLGNNHYYLNSNGVMATGWKWIGDNCYYFYGDGHMATDETIDGNYVDSNGIWIPYNPTRRGVSI